MGASVSWQLVGGFALCHVYGHRPPILTAYDGGGTSLTVSSDAERVTSEHLAFARELAECVRRYAEECERWTEQTAPNAVRAGRGAPSAA